MRKCITFYRLLNLLRLQLQRLTLLSGPGQNDLAFAWNCVKLNLEKGSKAPNKF